MVMLKNWLLRIFGLSEIVAKQAFDIDNLQMQCDLYKELAVLDANIIGKIVTTGQLWEPNDVY